MDDFKVVTYHGPVLPGTVCYLNDTYQVLVEPLVPGESEVAPPRGFPPMVWLSIKRRDKLPIDLNHWRILQEIKNKLVGPECEAVELYPAESRLVDTSNQYHLWCMKSAEHRFKFGYQTRLVMGAEEAAQVGARQRSFPSWPHCPRCGREGHVLYEKPQPGLYSCPKCRTTFSTEEATA